MYNLELLSVASVDLIPVVELQSWLRVDDPTQTAELQRLARAAVTKFQEYTGRQIVTASYKMTRRAFPKCGRVIRIPKPPFVSLTSLQYYDTTATLTDYTTYQISKGEIFCDLEPGIGGFWPGVTAGRANGVEVTFVCGYGSTRESIDEDLIHTLKVLIGHWYENREAGDLPEFVQNLWGSWYTGEQA